MNRYKRHLKHYIYILETINKVVIIKVVLKTVKMDIRKRCKKALLVMVKHYFKSILINAKNNFESG